MGGDGNEWGRVGNRGRVGWWWGCHQGESNGGFKGDGRACGQWEDGVLGRTEGAFGVRGIVMGEFTGSRLRCVVGGHGSWIAPGGGGGGLLSLKGCLRFPFGTVGSSSTSSAESNSVPRSADSPSISSQFCRVLNRSASSDLISIESTSTRFG